MKLSGLHLLLTLRCTFECEHCFVWGSPWQTGVMNLAQIDDVLRQARTIPSIESIYFEGGEPFLYYATLLAGVRLAASAGFQVGIVTNGYWAPSVSDALEYLRPLVGLVGDLTVSCDAFHQNEQMLAGARSALAAAQQLGIPTGEIAIARPDESQVTAGEGQVPTGKSAVMYRGRAVRLAGDVPHHPWTRFTTCPHENLREPGRVHVDPIGNLHVCQGLIIGNLFQRPLSAVCAEYSPESHPVVGSLLFGGPAELARRYSVSPSADYADACHLCYDARRILRGRFPELLGPDGMYGVGLDA